MFDIGWPELMLIMVVALVVIGPKDLPAAIRTVTTILRKVRGMAADFQSGLDDIAREAGVELVGGCDACCTARAHGLAIRSSVMNSSRH